MACCGPPGTSHASAYTRMLTRTITTAACSRRLMRNVVTSRNSRRPLALGSGGGSPQVVPLFWVDRQSRALAADVQVLDALHERPRRIWLEHDWQLLGQVVLPFVHQVRVGVDERLLDQPVIIGVGVLAEVPERIGQEQDVAGGQVVRHVAPAESPVSHFPRASSSRAAGAFDHGKDVVERSWLQSDVYADLGRVRLQLQNCGFEPGLPGRVVQGEVELRSGTDALAALVLRASCPPAG